MKSRVLVVDDDPALAEMLTIVLRGEGFDTAVVAAWVTNEGARIGVLASESEVRAATLALQGVQREARAGQRTTLDVLNAQQALVNARVALVTAQHDRVVASYSVLDKVGRLSPQVLNLATTVYDPSVHYHQVRDKWIGVRTPDGR